MNIIQPNYQWNGSLTKGNEPEMIVLHHAEAVSCSAEDIHRWHKGRGWSGIGYHYFVKKDGSIYKGRPDDAWGAHCPGVNEKSIGISVEGAYDDKDTTMPAAQRQSVVELCRTLTNRYGFTRIVRHRDIYSTSCPGRYYPFDQIVAETFSKDVNSTLQQVPVPQPVANRNWLQVGDQGSRVSELQEKLNKLGFDCGSVDGDYGKLTKNAVYAFQHKFGLQEDGLAGDQVFAKLNELLNNKPDTVGNEKVRSIQQLCNRLGIKGKNGQSLTEDGLYGPNTEFAIKQLPVAKKDGYKNPEFTKWIQGALGISVDGVFWTASDLAVRAFQQKYNLEADGQVGFNTLKAMLFN